MTKEELLQDELQRVKFRIQILNMIEDKLREMKALAEQVVRKEIGQEEIANIQFRVNELVNEISSLEKLEEPEVLH
ncbi:hypothetical protein Dred_2424 [Desulforamulus reducens MI-1]|uniref:Uncharacterized protein n=1 Tax=Desulforamulus reducens (strain ATCC BAA-1160 / DSM 100696 / MI-1) TaxID=349161 RepID=A4J781_DESRM|nr:hypothetical protein [Desulforamulus reducens]ABO50934.1 hypothetical protein Dred_2424 [Desulforamulus reducens MI-1]